MPLNASAIINNMLDIGTIDPKRYVAPWSQTRWVTLSSIFFLVPSVYGFANKELTLSVTSGLTALCSINYWRDATYSWRRTADVIVAKISFATFIIVGPRVVTRMSFLVTGYSGLFSSIYCYYMSNKYADTEFWWKYHMMFHLFMSYSQFIVIKSAIDNRLLCARY
jgi:hypothetical protein